MFAHTLPPRPRRLTLSGTRFIRLFAYGALSVVLVFYLVGLGLTASQTGMLLTATSSATPSSRSI